MLATDEEREPAAGARGGGSGPPGPGLARQLAGPGAAAGGLAAGLRLVASVAAGQGRLRASADALRETHLQLCEAATRAEAGGRLLAHPRVAGLAWSARRAVRELEGCVRRLLADLEGARGELARFALATEGGGCAAAELDLALVENRTSLLRLGGQLADLRLLQDDRPGTGCLDLADLARAALRALPDRLALGVTFVAELAHGEAQAILAMLARACVLARGDGTRPGTVLVRTGSDQRGLHVDVRVLPPDAEAAQTMLWLRLPRGPGGARRDPPLP